MRTHGTFRYTQFQDDVCNGWNYGQGIEQFEVIDLDLVFGGRLHGTFGDIALLSSSFPRIDDFQVTVYKIINISCNDCSLMSLTNSSDLGIELGDRDASGSAMGG